MGTVEKYQKNLGCPLSNQELKGCSYKGNATPCLHPTMHFSIEEIEVQESIINKIIGK